MSLVEREPELAALQASLTEASAGRPQVVLVTAEAGGGKTALIERFCAGCTAPTRVLRGACDPLFTPRPLGPFLDVASDVGAGLKSTLLGDAIPHEVAAALIEELRRRKPTVLVVEDIHWADEATQDVLRLVLRRVAGERVLIVLSYRDEALDVSHPVRVMLGELATAVTFTRMPLSPLSPEAVAQIADPYEVEPLDLHRVTAGNPFFVTEVLASGSEAIPATVRDAVLARAARLSSGARDLLGAIAIAPQGVELWLLDALAGKQRDALDECLSSGMLVEHAAGTISFRHELARLAIEESLDPRRRLSLHRAALAALSEPPVGSPDVARLAHHADASGDADAVLRYAPAAAEHAAAVGAHREAAAHYARVLRFGDRLSAAERAELLEKRSRACYVTDDNDEAIEAAQEALELRRALGQRLEEGESLTWLAQILYCPGRMAARAEAARAAVEVLETLPPSPQLAYAYLENDWTHAEKALALGEALGDSGLVFRARTIIAARDFPEGGLELEECVRLAQAARMTVFAAGTSVALVTGALEKRRYDLAARYLDSGLAYCSELGLELYRFYHLAWRARIELDQGRWDDAAGAAATVLRIRRASIMPRIVGLVVLALVRARRGDPGHRELLDEAWSLAEPTGDLFRMRPVVAARAEAAWLAGDREAVAAITADPLRLALEREERHCVEELGVWRRRAGIDDELSGAAETDAAQLWADAGCPYEAALALADANEEEPLRQALDELQRLGARPAASIVMRRLRELGVRDIRRGPRQSTSANAAALTARELDVLRLLADGLRNAAIGEGLFLSPRTVEHHVSAILAKLRVQSRGEAVVRARQLGLLPAP